MLLEIVGIILTSTILSAIITGLWNNYHIKRNFEHSQKIQTSKYYRELGGEKLKSIMEKWINVLIDIENNAPKNAKEARIFIGETLNYASPETTRRLATYQQYNYLKLDEPNAKKENKDFLYQIVLVAGIIASLKHDFTGEWTDLEDIIKVRINNFKDYESDFSMIIKKYKY